MLIDALRLVAAPYEVQLAVLPKWVVVADEIALWFDDALVAVDRTELAVETSQVLGEIERMLDAMTAERSIDLWSAEALEQRPEWSELRTLASKALHSLGVESDLTRFDGTTYVRSVFRRSS